MQYLVFFQSLVQTWVGLLIGRLLCAAALVMRDRYWSSHTIRSCHVESLSIWLEDKFQSSFLLRRDRETTLQNAHCFLFLRRLLSQLLRFYLPNLCPFLLKPIIYFSSMLKADIHTIDYGQKRQLWEQNSTGEKSSYYTTPGFIHSNTNLHQPRLEYIFGFLMEMQNYWPGC